MSTDEQQPIKKSEYLTLACCILGVDDVEECDYSMLPPTIDYQTQEIEFHRDNIECVTHEVEQALGARMCALSPGLTAEYWNTLDEEQRLSWMRLAAARLLKGSEESDKPAATEPTPRLVVDLLKKTATFDGRTFDVDSENALRWLQVLAEHPNEWIPACRLDDFDPLLEKARPDRFALPAEIKSLIDSETGKGSRIRL